jgi:hypothetical protein
MSGVWWTSVCITLRRILSKSQSILSEVQWISDSFSHFQYEISCSYFDKKIVEYYNKKQLLESDKQNNVLIIIQ